MIVLSACILEGGRHAVGFVTSKQSVECYVYCVGAHHLKHANLPEVAKNVKVPPAEPRPSRLTRARMEKK
eukprot:10787311-Lingulodinium_polyedra.AAC.1